MTTTLDLTALREDGDTLDIGRGRSLRLVVSPDFDTDINDFDFYGKIGQPETRRSSDWTGRKYRPQGFTGNAEILHGGQRSYVPVWWEPPADVKRGTPEFARLRETVSDLLNFGFHCVKVELLEGRDAYGRPIVKDFEVIGGVDSLDGNEGLIADLVAQVLAGMS